MLSVNQEIPEELVQTEKAVLCPLYAGQMSVSYTLQQFTKFYMMMINAMTSVMAAIWIPKLLEMIYILDVFI